MKPTQQEIIELARDAGIVFDERAMPYYERLVHLALERFGAGGGEPVAVVSIGKYPWNKGLAVVDLERPLRVGTKLYTHPSPTALRAEYERGLEDAAKVCDEYSGNWYAYRKGAEQCAASIRALKGKQ